MTKTRKHLTRLRLLGLVSALPLLGFTTQAQSTITNGLVAYWNFDSLDYKDSVGKFDGTPNGTDPIQFVSGKAGFGQAIQLNGVDQFVEITGRDATYDPDQLAFAGGAVSISAWFTVGSFDKSWQALVAKGEGSDWRVARDGSTSFMSYAGGLTDATGQTDVTDGKWHHIVAISDPAGANFGTAIYVDGNLDGTISGNAALVTNGKNMKIGDNPDATGRYWNGMVDDVAIWNRVLTQPEIAALYAGGSGKPISSFFGGQSSFLIGTPTGSTDGFTISVVDGGGAVADTSTIVLKFDGATVTPSSVSSTNGITTVAYNVPTPPLASGSSHTTSLTIKDKSGASHSADGTFTAPTYPTIDPSIAVTGVDTSKPGFRVRPYQVASGQPNTIAWTEEMFAGLHGDNISDLSQVISGKPIGADGFYTYTDVINWDKDGSSDGNFTANNGYQDIVMPGQPSADGNATYNNDGEEVLTYVQFPKGGQFYSMGVNSDDGFKVSTGANPRDAFKSVTLGEFNGGRGSADTIFKFWVPQPGIYPMRLLWENGGSGANCEWFVVQPDKTKVLLNDPSSTNTTGIKAFYSGPATPSPAYVVSFTSSLASGQVILADAGTQVTESSVQVSLNGSVVPSTATKTKGVTVVKYTLAAPLPSGSSAALQLVYKDNTSASVTNGTTFVAGSFSGVTKDSVKGYVGYIRGGQGGFTADGGGHSGAKGDYAIDTLKTGGTWVDIEDVSFLNAAAPAGKLSVSFWLKKYDIAAGSAFWAQLSQVTDGTDLRGFQAHVPWSDDNIYFDTMGCCDTGLQRISANINTFADYNTVGSDAYWTNWHHFVFTKNADQKNIYIDGKLFLNGSSTDPLQPNFTAMGLLTDGVPGGDFMHGVIDDFAVYSSEISAADAAKLASGTSPKSLSGETLIAYWDFNDASAAPSSIKISGVTASGGNITISWSGGGTLQSAASIQGPWTDVTGKNSPATVPASGKVGFFRIKQ